MAARAVLVVVLLLVRRRRRRRRYSCTGPSHHAPSINDAGLRNTRKDAAVGAVGAAKAVGPKDCCKAVQTAEVEDCGARRALPKPHGIVRCAEWWPLLPDTAAGGPVQPVLHTDTVTRLELRRGVVVRAQAMSRTKSSTHCISTEARRGGGGYVGGKDRSSRHRNTHAGHARHCRTRWEPKTAARAP